MKNDTPRTNAQVYGEDTGYNGMVEVVSPQFARQLERELANTKAALADKQTEADDARDALMRTEARITRLIKAGDLMADGGTSDWRRLQWVEAKQS